MNFLVLLSLALAPGIAIGVYIYLKDKHEPEPLGLLFTSFMYGGVSTLVTLSISWPLDFIVTLSDTDVVHQFCQCIF